MITLNSFGFAKIKNRAGLGKVFDCRALPNPHNQPQLRQLDGRHVAVQQEVMSKAASFELMAAALTAYEDGEKVISFGCHGGMHRSVAMVVLMSEILRKRGETVVVKHMQL